MAAAVLPAGGNDNALAYMQLYGYRRYGSTPGFVNATPRDAIPSTDFIRSTDFTPRSIVPPVHLDLNPGPAGAKDCYWSEDDHKKMKKAHFAPSTGSRSTPTSPAQERSAFLQPRDPQYTVDTMASEVAHFLRETRPPKEPAAEQEKEDIPRRDNSVNRGKKMVKKTARRVLEAGNRQLPAQCQLPQLQRGRSPVRVGTDKVVEKVSKSGAKYYQIVPGADRTNADQNENDVLRRDWAPSHRAVRVTPKYRARAAAPRQRYDRSMVRTTDEETTDGYGTISESEGPLFRQPHYQPGTALGGPDLIAYSQSRKSSGDSALALPNDRKGSAVSMDSRMADGELTDNGMLEGPNLLSTLSNAAAGSSSKNVPIRLRNQHKTRTSTSSGHTQVICQGGRPVSRYDEHPLHLKSLPSPDIQTALASFPATPSNVPTRESSLDIHSRKADVKIMASALQSRADRARARKLRDLQQTRKVSMGSSVESTGSNTAARANDITTQEPKQTEQDTADEHKKLQHNICSHGYTICPHGCRHGHFEPLRPESVVDLHPEELAYRSSLPLPPPPGQRAAPETHPALRDPAWSPSTPSQPHFQPQAQPSQASSRLPARTPTPSRTTRSRANSATSAPLDSSTHQHILTLERENDALKKREANLNATLTAVLQLTGANLLNLSSRSSTETLNLAFSNMSGIGQALGQGIVQGLGDAQASTAAIASAAAVAAVTAIQAQQQAQVQAAQALTNAHANANTQAELLTPSMLDVPTRNGSTGSKSSTATATSTKSEKHTSAESGTDTSMTPADEFGGAGQNNPLEMYMQTRKCSLTPPLEE